MKEDEQKEHYKKDQEMEVDTPIAIFFVTIIRACNECTCFFRWFSNIAHLRGLKNDGFLTSTAKPVQTLGRHRNGFPFLVNPRNSNDFSPKESGT